MKVHVCIYIQAAVAYPEELKPDEEAGENTVTEGEREKDRLGGRTEKSSPYERNLLWG